MPRLTALKIKSLGDGRHSDGNGLYLRIRGAGRKWIFRYQQAGRVRDIVIGDAGSMTLSAARGAAAESRSKVRAGVVPSPAPKPSSVTLREAIAEWIAYAEGGWRSTTEKGHSERQLADHLSDLMGRQLASITRSDIVAILTPLWTDAPTVAEKLLSRTSRVFQRAIALNKITVNPADPDIIRNLMPRVRHQKQHHPAVPWKDAPAVWARLAGRGGIAANALRLLILTAVRSGECRGARWDEISDGVWTIPAERTKTGRQLRVPLSQTAVALIEGLPRIGDSGLLFPSRVGTPISDMALLKVQKLIAPNTTVHGWRSSFRTWGGDRRYDRDALELSLGHVFGGEVERAYARSDLLDERRTIIDAWSEYLSGK